MTAYAKAARAFRRAHYKTVKQIISQTRGGQYATEAQIRAATRQILQNTTSAMRRNGVPLPSAA